MREVSGEPVAHVDIDSFFLSVEAGLRPGLETVASAVSGGGRSVILSASYPARVSGVRAGQSVKQALSLCPNLVLVRGRYAAYSRCGKAVFEVVREYGGRVEQVSIDEAYWGLPVSWDEVEELVQEVRARLKEEFALPVSVGVSRSKVAAKMATELGKPDGVHVSFDPGEEFKELPVSAIPGVGPALEEKLRTKLEVTVIGDLGKVRPEVLSRAVGERTQVFLTRAGAGLDTPSVSKGERSVGAEETFREDLRGVEVHEGFERVLAKAFARLGKKAARGVTVKERSVLDKSRSHRLPAPSANTDALAEVARRLHAELGKERVGGVRLVGVSFEGVSEYDQGEFELNLYPEAGLTEVQVAPEQLRDVGYVGMRVTHPRFGEGVLTGAESGLVRVKFPDKERLLDADTARMVF